MVATEVYLLAILTALCFGANQVAAKKGFEAGGSSLLITGMVIGFSGLLYWTLLIVSVGLGTVFSGLSLFGIGLFLAGGVIGTGVARLSVYAGVKRVGASVNSAGTNVRPLFSAILAVVLLGEVLTPVQSLGIVILVVGVIVLSLSKGGDLRGWKLSQLAFPLVAALAFASGNVIRRYGYTVTTATAVEAAALNETAALVTFGLYVGVRYAGELNRAFVAPRRVYGYFFVASILAAVGTLSLFFALSLGPVTIVDPLVGTAPLFALVFTHRFLGGVEGVNRWLALGVLLVVAGAGLITAT
ncbi:DMT family transporter [Haladaptatus sp. DJG-WS-42]|uniref:DMT family transporter n=1 Tax=Haladaptatus sp. DJG-WS-42 TaxID=3120516 RepID=UPI0030CF61EB